MEATVEDGRLVETLRTEFREHRHAAVALGFKGNFTEAARVAHCKEHGRLPVTPDEWVDAAWSVYLGTCADTLDPLGEDDYDYEGPGITEPYRR